MKLLPFGDLRAAKGIVFSRAQIYRLVKAGAFPRQIRVGGQRVGWIESEIDAWIESKIHERDSADGEAERARLSAAASNKARLGSRKKR
jgi:prophage regulatory protein